MTTATRTNKAGKKIARKSPRYAVPESQSEAAAKEAAASETYNEWRGRLAKLIDLPGHIGGALNDQLLQLYHDGTTVERAATLLQAEQATARENERRRDAARSVGVPAVPGVLIEIPLTHIHPAPFNPRTEFDPTALRELADSIKRQGLIQAVEVRAANHPGYYELVAGERRWRAAELAGLKTITAHVVDVTEEEARERCIEENLRRADLNPIEKARALQLLADNGLTQAAIAKRVGYANASQVTNELAMLKLPDDWQEAIRSGEVPATHTRHLAAWRERPNVLAKALALYRQRVVERGHCSQKDFEHEVVKAARACSKSLAQGAYLADACPFKPTAAQIAELDVVEIKSAFGGPGEKRAFNVALWKQLAKEATAKKKAKAAKAESAKPAADTPAANRWQIARIVKRWVVAELVRVAPTLKGEAALRLSVALLMNRETAEVVVDLFATGKGKGRRSGEALAVAGIFDAANGQVAKQLPQLAMLVLQALAANEYHGYLDLDLDAQLELCRRLGIDYAATFRPTAEAFEPYPPAMRKKMAEERGVENWGKLDMPALQAALAKVWPAGELPPGYEPEALAEF